jgi:hypothetical protein
MKCTYTSKNCQLAFEFEATDPKDLFLQRSIVEMHDEEACGMCGCKNIRCEVRRSGEYTFYEMRCQNRECGARLEFGQNKDMKNLFVKRSEHPKTNGWFIYQGSDRDHDEAPSNTQHPPVPKTPVPTRSGTPAPRTPTPNPVQAEPFAKALNGLKHAHDLANLDAWAKWAKAIVGLTTDQHQQLEDAYRERRTDLEPTSRRK